MRRCGDGIRKSLSTVAVYRRAVSNVFPIVTIYFHFFKFLRFTLYGWEPPRRCDGEFSKWLLGNTLRICHRQNIATVVAAVFATVNGHHTPSLSLMPS